MGVRRSNRHRGKVLRARLAHQRAGLHEVLEVQFDVLIIDVQLAFEIVQLRIVEDGPPVAADFCVGRLSDGPVSVVLRLGRHPAARARGWRFLKGGRRLTAGG